MPSETLPSDSARTDEILTMATEVLVLRETAEWWMEEPAISLDQERLLSLLSTSAGADIVETFLERLRYGVYT